MLELDANTFDPVIHLNNAPSQLAPASGTLITSSANSLYVTSSDASYTGTIVTAKSGGGNSTSGLATLASGTITISTNAVSASSIILVNHIFTGDPPYSTVGILTVKNPGSTSFTVNSVDLTGTLLTTDNGTICWQIINPIN